MKKILQILLLFISMNTSLLAQFETLVISINDESPKLEFKGSRNVIYNRSFDNYLKEALSEVILLTDEAGWNQTFQATSWSSFFEASKEQSLQEMVDDVTSGSAADKLGGLNTTDFKLLRDASITDVDERSSATQFEVRLTLVEVKTGKEFNKSDFIDIKGRNTRERGESIKKGLTKLLAELFMDKFPREPILNVNSLDNRAAVPVIKNRSISGKHGKDIISFLSAVVGDQNIQADDLTFQITGQPTNGQVRITNRNQLIYTPNPAFTGTDTVEYFVSYIDKNGFAIRSQPKTISIKVSNTKPVAKSGLESVRQDSEKTFILQGSDSDGDKLVYEILSQPLRGKLFTNNRVPGQFTYTPYSNVTGSDKFTFRVFDGAEYSDEVVFNLQITKVNKVPVARSFNVELLHDTDYEDFFQGQDDDGDKLEYFVTKNPANGSLSSNDDNKFTYRPNRGFVGQDTFNYRAVDSNGARSNTATILIEVTNQKPSAISRSYNGSFTEEFIIDLEGRDPDVIDDSRLSVKVYKQPFGSLEKVRGTKSKYRYKNTRGVDEDDIIFQVFDGVENSDFAKISLKLDKNNTQVSSKVDKNNTTSATKNVRSSTPRNQVKPVSKPKPTRIPSQQQASNDKDDDGGSNMTLILVLLLVVVLAAAGGGGGGGSDPTGGVDIGITIP
ncbi:MAG: Ig-like domain-containing protein [Candidatus Neomarinimicrobiota bacterium]